VDLRYGSDILKNDHPFLSKGIYNMDSLNPIYIVLAIVIAIVALVCFWLLSKKAQKGALLAVAIAMWVIGKMIGSQPVRELKLIGGTIQTLGTIGIVLGVVDLCRKRKTESQNRVE
jgi:hypothetical protein